MEASNLQEIYLRSLTGPLSQSLDLVREAEISYLMDATQAQDSFRFRCKFLGLRVASLLIDDKGELDRVRLEELHQIEPFFIGPRREGDALIYGHIKNCLKLLAQHPEIWGAIRRFSPPLCHKKADEIVRETLWPESFRTIQTVHVRKAVLAAWLTFLRQATGSCFATAPAILIQQHYPLRFFKDMDDLLSTGQIKRTVAGKEYSVPMSLNPGMGDLQRVSPQLEFSIGLKLALESVGIPLSIEKIREVALQTPETVLRSLILDDVGITEEDVEDEERLSRIQMTALLARQSAVYYQRPSERSIKVSDWKKKFAKACQSFRSLTECSLLRSWEYTIASLCDVKTEFARWNLYVGLGIHPDHKGGIGEFLYQQINTHLQKCNKEIQKLAFEYAEEARALQAIETMIHGAITDARRNQLKSEWTMHSVTLNSIHERRNELVARAEALAGFFSSLLNQYDQKLQEAFQELFDPAILGEGAHLFDDSPAGFRLVYKHGRADASQWTAIYTTQQYVDSLRDFFSIAESDLLAPPQIGTELISELTTALIQFIQTTEFANSALERAKQMGRRSPWDYVSGGTMQTLLQHYCNRDRSFTESKIIPKSERELFDFLSHFKEPMLMHSPTHAFTFHGLPVGCDRMLEENQQFVRKIKWDGPVQEYLSHRISEKLPETEKALFLHLFKSKNSASTKLQLRENLIESLAPRIKQAALLVDSVFFELTPLLPQKQAAEALALILRANGVLQTPKLQASYYGSYDLFQLAKMTLFTSLKTPFSKIDWDLKIVHAMRHFGFSQPHSLLFSDTNWSGWFFGFVAHPISGELELWRLNRTANMGFPMVDWKEWMSAKNSAPWVLLSKPSEYTDSF